MKKTWKTEPPDLGFLAATNVAERLSRSQYEFTVATEQGQRESAMIGEDWFLVAPFGLKGGGQYTPTAWCLWARKRSE